MGRNILAQAWGVLPHSQSNSENASKFNHKFAINLREELSDQASGVRMERLESRWVTRGFEDGRFRKFTRGKTSYAIVIRRRATSI